MVIALVITSGYALLPVSWPTYFYQTLLFLLLTTCGLFYYLLRSKKERPETFVQFYLLTLAVKMVAYAGFMIFVITRNRGEAPANVAFFMIVYCIFTATEVAFLYRKVSQ